MEEPCGPAKAAGLTVRANPIVAAIATVPMISARIINFLSVKNWRHEPLNS
jgi:hypothetical protein